MESSHTIGVDVDVVEQCRIHPPPGSVASPAHFPLTFLDLLWVPLAPVNRLFFYDVRLSKADFSETVLPKLKHSLSLTLQHFFPLAGNLAWPRDSTKPEIHYNEGDGVAFSVAESRGDLDFHHLSGNHPRYANLFYPLIPQLSGDVDSDVKLYPVLALQVTLFPDKGICIGVTYHHCVADGRILIHFVKSWASVCRGDTIEPLLCYDRSLVIDKLGLEMNMLDILKKFNITQESFNLPNHSNVSLFQDKVLATQVIRPCDVNRIKQWVLARVENETPLHLSTFVITCAYVWVCLIRATWGETASNAAEDPSEYFLFPADCRARRKPPLPPTYFGNCLASNVVTIKRSELFAQDGIVIAAERIGKKVQSGGDGDGLFAEDLFGTGGFASAKGRILSVAGATKLGIYETHFGWGKLRKAEVPSIAMTGAMSLCESPDEIGAVEVGLARSNMVMEAFTSLFTTTLQEFP